jgi:predicted HicB family RNase H-like nuclease
MHLPASEGLERSDGELALPRASDLEQCLMKTPLAPTARSTRPATSPAHASPLPPPASLERSPRRSARAVLQVAEDLHAMEPEWVVFFSEMLGVEGHIRRAFPTPEALATFECTPEYARIRELLDDLRSRQAEPAKRESRRVVTVRMPRSLHETLKAEARELRVSINQLCITKLIRILDEKDRLSAEEDFDDAALEDIDPLSDDDARGGADL